MEFKTLNAQPNLKTVSLPALADMKKENRGFLPSLLTLLFTLIALLSSANLQAQDWGSGGGDSGYGDSTDLGAGSSDPWGGGDDGGWGSGEEEEEWVQPKAVYVRFVPPYDSLRELIYYEGVVEDWECETCTSDSLYYRAKNFLEERFGKKAVKEMLVEDVVMERITMVITIPMITKHGEHKTKEEGKLEYRMTLRFKDDRYRYQFSNFVHIEAEDGTSGKQTRTYHEYYMRLKKGFQLTDYYLLSADREVKDMVEGIKYALRGPYQPDEDDW